MSNTIQKLNKLKNPESFIQINTLRGFKYIDKAGEIVNNYHNNGLVPNFDMGLNGLVVEHPKEKIHELKVTPYVLWMKFTKIDSLEMISNLFTAESSIILKILEVNNISRIGWRNYFIHEFSDKEGQEEYFKNLTKFTKGSLSAARFELDSKDSLESNLMIQPVIKDDEDKTTGVLFDIDIFQTGKITINDISRILNSFKDYIRNEENLLSILNETFIKSE